MFAITILVENSKKVSRRVLVDWEFHFEGILLYHDVIRKLVKSTRIFKSLYGLNIIKVPLF